MIDFRMILLSDKQWMEPLLGQSNFMGSEYVFSNYFNWREIYNIQVAQVDGYLAAASHMDNEPLSYLYPAGSGDIRPVILALLEDAKQRKIEFRMHGITAENCKLLETILPDVFAFQEERDNFDYIYESVKLQNLTGKKLSSKRNHINRFKENHPDWKYEAIGMGNIDECWKMSREWCRQSGCGKSESLRNEACAVKNAFDHFDALGLRGGLLRTDGKVVAYTMGRPLNSDTFVVHIEKAFADIQGAYPMINQQFVLHNCTDFRYVNREDDVGAEGLRKAKLSYDPAILLPKYSARPRAV